MLANNTRTSAPLGKLAKEIHPPDTFKREVVNFIARELPSWRDDKARKPQTAETRLTTQLCTYLSSAARHASGLDLLLFQTEVADEQKASRTVDVGVMPWDCTIYIESNRYTIYDMVFPIECKRLPTPRRSNRDQREYVFSSQRSAGGIQRFKTGDHGAAHPFAAMIAYIQDGTTESWTDQIADWITDLVKTGEEGWTMEDHLNPESSNATQRFAVLHSQHTRAKGADDIELWHLWVEMKTSKGKSSR